MFAGKLWGFTQIVERFVLVGCVKGFADYDVWHFCQLGDEEKRGERSPQEKEIS